MYLLQMNAEGGRTALCTPLMEAVKQNHLNIAQLLVDHGAQVSRIVVALHPDTSLSQLCVQVSQFC